ncbi:S24 family peptidase [Vibrio sp. HN007]|uniref:helix-turn-helix domain-containing protein n=1 Tax=Vibrio iocasae TaxID=3098914 RepID=UPI0035D4D84F
MREWFTTLELIDLDGLPSSNQGLSQKAKRMGWVSRKAKGKGTLLEYHISNFDDFIIAQLRQRFGVEEIPDNVTEITNIGGVKSVHQMDVCPVPVYNVYAACGWGAENGAEYIIRTEFLPCQWLARFGLTEDTAKIITCKGDSMEDTLSDGDEVLVDIREQEHPVNHGVYVVRIGKHAYIKRLKYDIMAEGYEVISDNKEEYPSFIVNGEKLKEFAVMGKVVTTVMKTVV